MAKKDDTMVCDECGLAVTVCDECGCETDQLICCGQPMRTKRATRSTARRTSKRTKTRK